MPIRKLDPITDRALVEDFFAASTDYILLERDTPPGAEVTEEYFTDTPPGCDLTKSLRLGLFESGLVGLAEMSFGFPDASAAYIGLLLITPIRRGTGAGPILLRHLETEARKRGATGLYLGVLETNPKGRAFWHREGFAATGKSGMVTLGRKTQLAHRLGKTL
jgi:GNAT superfamily N-acetyltransferase